MALIPAGEAYKLLQWYDAGGGTFALRNRSMDDLLDDISATAPTANKYYLDVTNVATQASADAVTGTGSVAGLGISGTATMSAAAVSGTGALATVTAFGGTSSMASADAVSGTGALGDVTVTGGAGISADAVSGTGTLAAVAFPTASLAVVNPGFESAIGGTVVDATYAPQGNWNTQSTAAAVSLITSSPMTGSQSVRFSPDTTTAHYVNLIQQFTKATVEAGSVVTFDARLHSSSGSTWASGIRVRCYNSSGALISDDSNDNSGVGIFGAPLASSGDNSHRITSPTLDAIYTISFDAKAFALAHYGSTVWSNTGYVKIELYLWQPTGNAAVVDFDNFR